MMNAELQCPECDTNAGFRLLIKDATDINPIVLVQCIGCRKISNTVPLCCFSDYPEEDIKYDETSD